MAYFEEPLMLKTVHPFATPPTVIKSNLSEMKKAIVSGIGTAIGIAMTGSVLWWLFGKK